MVKHECTYCNFSTTKKSNFDRHNETNKHLQRVQEYKRLETKSVKCTENAQKNEKKFTCSYCGVSYTAQRSLQRHMSSCFKKMELQFKYSKLISDFSRLQKSKDELENDYLTSGAKIIRNRKKIRSDSE